MKVDESGWMWMNVDGSRWNWTEVDQSGWKRIKLDDGGWKYPRCFFDDANLHEDDDDDDEGWCCRGWSLGWCDLNGRLAQRRGANLYPLGPHPPTIPTHQPLGPYHTNCTNKPTIRPTPLNQPTAEHPSVLHLLPCNILCIMMQCSAQHIWVIFPRTWKMSKMCHFSFF